MGSCRPRSVALLAAVALIISAAGVFSFWVNPHSLIPLVAIVVLLSVGVLARLRRPEYRPTTFFLGWCVALAGYLASVYGTFVFPLGRALDTWCLVFVMFYFFLAPAFLAFALSLSEVAALRSRIVLAISVALAAGFSGLRLSGVWQPHFIDTGIKRTVEGHPLYLASLVFIQVSFWYGLLEVLVKYRRLPPGTARERLKWFLLVSAATNVFAYFNALLSFGVAIYPVSAVVLSAYGVFLAYLIVKFRFLGIEIVIGKAVSYAAYTTVLAASYAGFLLVSGFVLGPLDGDYAYLGHGVVIVLIGFLAVPLRSLVQNLIDRRLFRDHFDRRRSLELLAESLVSMIDMKTLQRTVLDNVVRTVKIEGASIHAVREDGDRHTLALSAIKTYGKPVEFAGPSERPFRPQLSPSSVQVLREARCTPFLIGRDDEGAGASSCSLPPQIVQFAAASGAEVVLPIAGTDGAQTVMFLQPKLSELPFSDEDLSLLGTVATHAAVAFENALNYESVLRMQSYMASILMSLEDGLFTVSSAGQMGSLNDAAKRILGLDDRCSDLADYGKVFKSYPAIRGIVERSLSGHFSKGEEVPYGGETLSITTTRLSSERGEVAGVLVAFTDITENKRLAELVKRNERLTALGEMAAYVAHEIKNPITSMRLLATALPGRLDDERFLKTAADVIPSEVNRLDAIIRDLLEYARPAKLTRVDLDLESVTKRSVQILRSEMEEQGIRLSENYSADRQIVTADGEKLKQVFVNVMKNAMEAAAESKEKAIRVGVMRRGKFLAVRVDDSGMGMTQEHQSKLFRPFFSTKRQGTGLGLAISQKIVEEHGGRIEVASSPGKGSTFTIVLPAQG